MKRIALLLSITLVLFATGCTKSGSGDEAATGRQQMDVSAGSAGSAASDSGSTIVYGRVDSIVGNEVALSLGEPQRSGGSAASSGQDSTQAGAEQQSGASDTQTGTSDTQSGASDTQTGTHQRGNWSGNTSGSAPSGEAPSGGMPSGEAPSGEMPSGEAPSGEMPSGEAPSGNTSAAQSGSTGGAQQIGGRSVSLTYTGETATYLLPVGMAIGTGDFSDVTVGMVLSLTLNADKTITAVSILSR